jgi:hypothetical protein
MSGRKAFFSSLGQSKNNKLIVEFRRRYLKKESSHISADVISESVSLIRNHQKKEKLR